jgi:hypothetical protein
MSRRDEGSELTMDLRSEIKDDSQKCKSGLTDDLASAMIFLVDQGQSPGVTTQLIHCDSAHICAPASSVAKNRAVVQPNALVSA